MAYNVKILPTAEQEVDDIVEYLMGHGINTARRFLAKYRQQLEILQSGVADYGLSFLRELRGLGYHACPVNSYAMLYYYEGSDVVIAHVFHQSQDYARLSSLMTLTMNLKGEMISRLVVRSPSPMRVSGRTSCRRVLSEAPQ